MYVPLQLSTPLADESVQDMLNQDPNSGYSMGRYVPPLDLGEANE
jgi:hypothetical protein